MKEQILKLKLELKNLAKTIRIQKNKRCTANNGCVPGLHELRQYYRHRHVLYCLARGRTLEQVDSGNGLNMKYIDFHLEAMKEDKKLYVVVDSQLPMQVQAVQACHAIAEFMRKYPATTWKNGTLVLLKQDFRGGRHFYTGLGSRTYYPRFEYAEFKEPDMGDRLTAYAAFGPTLEEHFRSFSLV